MWSVDFEGLLFLNSETGGFLVFLLDLLGGNGCGLLLDFSHKLEIFLKIMQELKSIIQVKNAPISIHEI